MSSKKLIRGELPSPFRFVEDVLDEEEELRIRQFSLTRLFAFDVGATWLRVTLDPSEITRLLVHEGHAIANEYLISRPIPHASIYRLDEYTARELGLLDKAQRELLEKEKTRDDMHERFHERISEKIRSLREKDPKKLEDVEKGFEEITRLLGRYTEWDSGQIPTYVERGRFSRAIFKPILLRFRGAEEHLKGFRPVQVVASIHRSGVGCLSLWLYPAEPDKDLNVKDLLKPTQHPGRTEVVAAFPEEISSVAEQAIFYQVKVNRRQELDDEANRTDVATSCRIRYACWEGYLDQIARVFFFLIYKACLNSMQKNVSVENLNELARADCFMYGLLYILDIGGARVTRPFDEVVMKHPRQVFGMLARDEGFNRRTCECVRNRLVDVSPDSRASWMFGRVRMLTFASNSLFREVGKDNDGAVLWRPSVGDVGTAANFELLCCLRSLLGGYDLMLSRLLERGATVSELVRAEERITLGLEEIYEARHAIFGSVRDWWWLAEERLEIDELHKAVREKLEDVHRSIVTKRQEELSRFETTMTQRQEKLSRLQTVLAVLFGILGVAGFWEVIWVIGRELSWSVKHRLTLFAMPVIAIFVPLVACLWYVRRRT